MDVGNSAVKVNNSEKETLLVIPKTYSSLVCLKVSNAEKETPLVIPKTYFSLVYRLSPKLRKPSNRIPRTPRGRISVSGAFGGFL